MLTKEEKNSLEDCVGLFEQASKNYCCGWNYNQFNKCLGIYKKYINSKEILSPGCSKCVLKVFNKVGELYNTPTTKKKK